MSARVYTWYGTPSNVIIIVISIMITIINIIMNMIMIMIMIIIVISNSIISMCVSISLGYLSRYNSWNPHRCKVKVPLVKIHMVCVCVCVSMRMIWNNDMEQWNNVSMRIGNGNVVCVSMRVNKQVKRTNARVRV